MYFKKGKFSFNINKIGIKGFSISILYKYEYKLLKGFKK
jgi:hypothetical protein